MQTHKPKKKQNKKQQLKSKTNNETKQIQKPKHKTKKVKQAGIIGKQTNCKKTQNMKNVLNAKTT